MSFFKRFIAGCAIVAGLGAPLLTPAPAQAWWARPGYGWHAGYGWRGGWGWHGGWGWRGGVFIGAPAVVVRPPVVYAPARYRWIPGYFTPYGVWVGPHWGY